MGGLISFNEQKTAIKDITIKILQKEFGPVNFSVDILLDRSILVVRVEDFVCPAEISASSDSESAALILKLYHRQFDNSTAKEMLIQSISQITGKKVISAQIGVSFESRDLIITLFLNE